MAVDLYTDAKPRIGGRTVTPCLFPSWVIGHGPQHIVETLCSRPSLSSDVREPYVGYSLSVGKIWLCFHNYSVK